jgi:cephalosporin-C deacetylase
VFTDLPEPELRTYTGSGAEPDDFDAFWSQELARSRAVARAPRVIEADAGLSAIRIFDVIFSGWHGQPIRAWLRLPAHAAGQLPVIVEYVGYGGGRGAATGNLLYAAAGYAHLQMDTRGQGAGWSRGDTPDDASAGPQVPGVMTRGITAPETYYYTRLFTDAVLAVDAAAALEAVDATRIGVTGISQGGGTALAVAALAHRVRAVVARVPFLCDFPRSTTITDANPFHEIPAYLATHRDEVEAVFHTLGYIDVVHFARRGRVPALLSAALMDPVVPPSGVFAAYNVYPAEKEIAVWRFNGHEGGGPDDDDAALRFFARTLAAPAGD